MKLDRATLTLLIVLELARLVQSHPVVLNAITLLAYVRIYRALAPGKFLIPVRDSTPAMR